MKPTLQIRLGQSLTLTPQLRLAIRLLQLSAVELEVEINDAVDSNPLLEREEDEVDAPVFEPGQAPANAPDDAPPDLQAGEVESFGENDAFDDTPEFRWDEDRPAGSGSGSEGEDREEGRAAPLDLHEHLSWQLHLSHLTDRSRTSRWPSHPSSSSRRRTSKRC